MSLARTFLRRARAAQREHLMPAAMHNLGSVQLARGEFKSAEATLAAALVLKKASSGASANVASCLNDLGISRKQLGKLRAAETCFSEALAIYADVFGDGPSNAFAALPAAARADVACTRINLGNVYMSVGNTVDAEACYVCALEAFRAIHGPGARNADVAKALGNLGVVRDARGEYAAAVRHHALALDMQLAVYGPDAVNAELANSRENLGNALSHRGGDGDLARAEAELLACLAMRHALSAGQDYPLVRTLAKLGDVASKLRADDAACARYASALRILETMQPTDPLVAHKKKAIGASLAEVFARVAPAPAGG